MHLCSHFYTSYALVILAPAWVQSYNAINEKIGDVVMDICSSHMFMRRMRLKLLCIRDEYLTKMYIYFFIMVLLHTLSNSIAILD